MSVKETITVEEKLTVFVRDENGIVREYVYKKPWSEKTLWEKVLFRLGLKKESGTLQTDGIRALACLYGGNSDSGLYAIPITYLASYCDAGPAYIYRSITRSFSTPTLTITNIGMPWDTTGTYTGVHLTSVATGFNPFHSIGLGDGDDVVKIGTGCAWWAEVKLTFSSV